MTQSAQAEDLRATSSTLSNRLLIKCAKLTSPGKMFVQSALMLGLKWANWNLRMVSQAVMA